MNPFSDDELSNANQLAMVEASLNGVLDTRAEVGAALHKAAILIALLPEPDRDWIQGQLQDLARRNVFADEQQKWLGAFGDTIMEQLP